MFKKVALSLLSSTLLVLASSAHATPVSFNLSLNSLTLGSSTASIGVSNPDVYTAPISFSLNSVGDSYIFNVGTISLNTATIPTSTMSSAYGLAADFIFTMPTLAQPEQSLSVLGITTAGPVADQATDYQLLGVPETVYMTDGTSFDFSLISLSFGNNGTATLKAIITLDSIGSDYVPEPASLGLLGLGLFGLGAIRRKRAN